CRAARAGRADWREPTATATRLRGRCGWRRRLSAPGPGCRAGTGSSATGPALPARAGLRCRAWRGLSDGKRHEVVVRDRVFVLLAQEPLLHEHVDVGRVGVCILTLEHADRVHVLLAAEDQLFFLFALRGVLP